MNTPLPPLDGGPFGAHLSAPIGTPVECGGCGQQIVQLEGGHYRLDVRLALEDRLRCKVAGGHPVTAETQDAMRRVSPPWSSGPTEAT